VKEITVDGTKYRVYGKNEDVKNPKSHIANSKTGEVPEGLQRGIL
jgi:hypothetical protein